MRQVNRYFKTVKNPAGGSLRQGYIDDTLYHAREEDRICWRRYIRFESMIINKKYWTSCQPGLKLLNSYVAI